jgi:creatinine amidohydrolase/Fe(II)-dependent formamide hydrolase-like protein
MLPVGTDGHKRIKGKEWWGMEQFAKVPLPGSLFVKEATFRALMRDTVAALEKTGFKAAVLCTGHQAPNQIKVIRELEAASKRRKMKVLGFWTGRVDYSGQAKSRGGHAGATESSELMAVSGRLAVMSRAGKLKRDQSVGLTPEAFQGKVSAAHGLARFRVQAAWIQSELRKLGFH